MPERHKDNLTGNLFNPKPELKPGETINAEGNVYNEKGLIREAPSPELVEARERVRSGHPDIDESDPRFGALAKIYLREIKQVKKKQKDKHGL